MTAYLLLAAMAWAGATRGGTDPRDLAIVFVLVAASAVAARARPRAGAALWSAVGLLLAYLIVDGPLRTGWSLESIRMPVLVVLVTLTLLAVGAMSNADREVLISGMIILGTLQALIALAAVIFAALSGGQGLSVPARGAGLVGFPNGLGILLVGTSILTVRQLTRGRRRIPLAVALALQVAAILATGSRVAIVVGVLALAVFAVHLGSRSFTGRRAFRGRSVLYALAIGAAAAGAAIVVWRTLVEPNEDRPQLWAEAAGRIAAAPLFGEGAPAGPFRLVSESSRVTASAHNEILQWALEYGVIGLALAGVVIVLAVRGTRPWSGGDRWALVAALALLASGFTGFSPRITVVAVAAAALMALGVTHAPDRLPSPRRGRTEAPAADVL